MNKPFDEDYSNANYSWQVSTKIAGEFTVFGYLLTAVGGLGHGFVDVAGWLLEMDGR